MWPEKAPTSGVIDATYQQRNGSVDLRNLQVNMPFSHVTAHGQLGAFPMTSPTGLSIEVHSSNLDDFDTLFRDFGITRNGKTGISALPVDLDGQADFKGTWAGSLDDPHLAGELQATNLSVEIPMSNNPSQTRAVALGLARCDREATRQRESRLNTANSVMEMRRSASMAR